ncbi:hypothetical protein DSM106972_050580 [Dulcicalothrix desertica PCC 7102]|uniref:Uncharacterized protein n=1 Tax=Dulcicalothrix desertica PCC 7102 TaxID=232991 RepID=A0A433VBM6_9CYAN|nr:XRE family transcriptional regulator [Dulcicalothrix desertica]RUT03419.1 hypothetical protein DSM106972_050580 [Dulcicalothrix desertica PCC 7102]TWH50657.1 hypothetical protein CAL7102_04987 [Dulcicalothrix desertica PCC 7102]
MSNFSVVNPNKLPGTSALGAMRHLHNYRFTGCRILMAHPSTATDTTINFDLIAACEMTTSGLTLPSACSGEVTRKALNELRRLSGLTWEQLAKLFNVSRRSLHFWASGQPLSHFNEENLNRLLGTIQYIDRGSASLNRSLLLKPDNNGKPLFDLLMLGKYEEVKQILGRGNAPNKPKLLPLSQEARLSRAPQKPEDLVDALQDKVELEVKRSRPVKAAKSQKKK